MDKSEQELYGAHCTNLGRDANARELDQACLAGQRRGTKGQGCEAQDADRLAIAVVHVHNLDLLRRCDPHNTRTVPLVVRGELGCDEVAALRGGDRDVRAAPLLRVLVSV